LGHDARVSVQACPERRRGVVESRFGRAERNAQPVRKLRQRQPDVVVEHEDGSLLQRQPPEGALELVAIVDAEKTAELHRPVDRKEADLR
jgi:hypothetical protein